MASRGLFTILIVLLGLGVLFAGGTNVAYEGATDEFSVTNETISVDYSDRVAVEKRGTAFQYMENVTVYANGTELTAGTDYVWHDINGTIDWYDTANTTDGDTATISYEYKAPPENNRAMFGMVQIIGIGLTFIIILLVGQWLFDVVGDW